MSNYPQKNTSHEIIISGAGPVGLSLGIALSQIGFSCLLVSKDPVFESKNLDFDGRAYSIATGCWLMWETFGITDGLKKHVQPILKVEAEAASFSPLSIGLEDTVEEGPLGYLVEAHAILKALWKKAQSIEALTIIHDSELSEVETLSDKVTVRLLGNSNSIECKLLIGCDGKSSFVRNTSGIKYPGHDYEAKGIVATIALKEPHNGVARQIFLKGGPFAVLPLPNNQASLVWTERSPVADALMKLEDSDFAHELSHKVGDFLGDFELLTGRFSYPLKMRVAESFVSDRVALAGDAAHSIHPLAGQGLNLGLKDVAALAETITNAAHVGLDIGSPLALEPYEEWRRAETVNMAIAMDGMEKLFKTPAPLRGIAGLGMSLVGKNEFARGILSKSASASSGTQLPKLFKGEQLQY